MRKCLRCDTEMVEDLDVKVEGGAYELKLHNREFLKIIWASLNVLFVQSVDILKLTFKTLLKLKN